MTRWTGIVVAPPGAAAEEMMSRLPVFLHPVAGRPLVWHAVAALAGAEPAPERVLVVGGKDVTADLFSEIVGAPVTLVGLEQLGEVDAAWFGESSSPVLVVDAASHLPPGSIQALIDHPSGSWIGSGSGVAAARLDPQLATEVIRLPTPLTGTRGILTEAGRVEGLGQAITVRERVALAEVGRLVRDRVVAAHMQAGVTFLLPDSVLVDVDVRIGPDTVVYPGAVLEGQTTVGRETVIGPGCRIIDSWIGSGVEMKGWNYVSHTSVRNRAILEPYVRRGFD